MTALTIAAEAPAEQTALTLAAIGTRLRPRALHILVFSLLAGLVGLGIAFLIPPTFQARTTFMPPQQTQSNAASAAIASLGALSALTGAGSPLRTPADQYVALMQSVSVSDRIIDHFGLMKVYDVELRVDARKTLTKNVYFIVGKKDGLISVDVDDSDRQRAAAMANRYVEELRRLTSTLVVTEAQQRRLFFERLLEAQRSRLATTQGALASSGFNEGALKSEPKAAAENYARLRAQVTAGEVRLQALHESLADDAPEVRQQAALLGAFRQQLSRAEAQQSSSQGDYVSRYRDFKYQETLFELYARQFELARVDESREGAIIQVIDMAQPPERRIRPKRAMIAIATTIVAAILLSLYYTFSAGRARGVPA